MSNWKKFYRFLGSLKLAIFWLVVLGFMVILGAVVPQGEADQITKGTLPEYLKQFLIFIEANDAYHSPLFLGLIACFFVSLAIATYEKIWPLFKMAFKKTKTPPRAALTKFKTKLEIKGADFNQAKIIIGKRFFKLVSEQEGVLHFERGKMTKTTPMIAHISLFLILFGVIITILTSFRSTVALVPGETAPISYVVSKSPTKGSLVAADQENWSVHVNKFWMDFHPNGMVKQYYSDLSVIESDSKKELLRKTIFVNEPLVYNGVYFYQASWGVSHLDVVIDGKRQNVMLQPLKNNQGNVSDKMKLGNGEYIFYLDQSNKVFVFDLQAQPVSEICWDLTPVMVGY